MFTSDPVMPSNTAEYDTEEIIIPASERNLEIAKQQFIAAKKAEAISDVVDEMPDCHGQKIEVGEMFAIGSASNTGSYRYDKEIKANYPLGSIGRVIFKTADKNTVGLQFEQQGIWTRDWNSNEKVCLPPDIARFRSDEVRLPIPEEELERRVELEREKVAEEYSGKKEKQKIGIGDLPGYVKQAIKRQTTKTKKRTDLVDLATQFVWSACAYIADHKHKSCKFSTYMDSLMMVLANQKTEAVYQQKTHQTQPRAIGLSGEHRLLQGIQQQGRVHPGIPEFGEYPGIPLAGLCEGMPGDEIEELDAYSRLAELSNTTAGYEQEDEQVREVIGLRAAIIELGDLIEDNPVVVENHSTFVEPTFYRAIVKHLVAGLEEYNNTADKRFMRRFINVGGSQKRSKIIEQFVVGSL